MSGSRAKLEYVYLLIRERDLQWEFKIAFMIYLSKYLTL